MAGKFRITYNAPVVLSFALLAVIVQVLPDDAKLWFAAWPELHDARSYLGLVTHVLGHGNWDHLLANFTLILLLGPILEERHGSRGLLIMIAFTALITGLVNVAITNSFLVGASGIVFMMILLASTANIRAREIPLTFIAVAILFLGREVVNAFRDDNVSQLAHVLGGVAGAIFGFLSAPTRSIAPGSDAVAIARVPVAPKPTPPTPAP